MSADPVKSAGILDKYWSPDLVYHSQSMGDLNFEQAKQFQINLYTALKPTITTHNLIIDGNMAAAQFTLTGTHQASMMGIPASGEKVKMDIVQIMKTAREKTVEIWIYYDNLSVMKQLGAVLPPVAAKK
jgi:predicted ester cyclase